MTLPWVSRRAYDLLIEAYSRDREAWFAGSDSLRLELEREREANRNLMASALALRNLSNPYKPENMTAPPKPIGRASAIVMIRELEEADRKAAKELTDGTAAATH